MKKKYCNTRTGYKNLADIITPRRFKMARHILRRPDTRHSKFVLSWTIDGKRKEVGQSKHGEELLKKILKELELH